MGSDELDVWASASLPSRTGRPRIATSVLRVRESAAGLRGRGARDSASVERAHVNPSRFAAFGLGFRSGSASQRVGGVRSGSALRLGLGAWGLGLRGFGFLARALRAAPPRLGSAQGSMLPPSGWPRAMSPRFERALEARSFGSSLTRVSAHASAPAVVLAAPFRVLALSALAPSALGPCFGFGFPLPEPCPQGESEVFTRRARGPPSPGQRCQRCPGDPLLTRQSSVWRCASRSGWASPAPPGVVSRET